MNQTLLVAQLNGRRIAMAASQIESIVEISRITPVPQTPDYIEGLSTLRSKALTVINCARVLKINREHSQADTDRQAAVVHHAGHDYALLLDAVEDVVETQNVPEEILGGVGDEWSDVALGIVETEVGPALMVNVEAFITVKSDTAH